MIKINNAKAIEIAKNKIRIIRDEQLKKQDVEFQKALEFGSDTAPIIDEKQRLRNLPQECEGKTLDELMSLMTEVGA